MVAGPETELKFGEMRVPGHRQSTVNSRLRKEEAKEAPGLRGGLENTDSRPSAPTCKDVRISYPSERLWLSGLSDHRH